MGFGCPECGEGALISDGPWAECATCGHRAATAFVTELTQLTEQHHRAEVRLEWLRDRVRAGDAAAPPPFAAPLSVTATLQPAPGWNGGPGWNATPQPTTTSALSGQRALLVAGGALLITAVAVFLTVNWTDLGLFAQVLVILLLVLLSGALSHVLRPHSPSTASTLAVVAAATLALGFAAAPHLVSAHPFVASGSRSGWYFVAGLITALLSAVAWRLTDEMGYATAAVGALISASVAEVAWLVEQLDALPLLIVATVQLLVLLLLGSRLPKVARGPLAAFAAAPGVLAAGTMTVTYVGYDHPSVVFGLLLLTACALLLRRDEPFSKVSGASSVAEPLSAVSMAIGGIPGPRPLLVVIVLVTAAAVAGVTVRRDRLLALAGTGPAAAGALLIFAASTPSAWDTALVWGTAAVACLALACLRPLRFANLSAIAFSWVAVAAWVSAQHFDISPEGFAVLTAGPVLAAAATWFVSTRSAEPSLLVWGPGLALLVLPSALSAAFGHDASARTLVVLVAAGALGLTGAMLRLAAPVVVAVVAAGIVLVGQLITVAEALPRWLGLSTAGVALLVAGLQVERLRSLVVAGRHRIDAFR